jgi:hypothetical protein
MCFCQRPVLKLTIAFADACATRYAKGQRAKAFAGVKLSSADELMQRLSDVVHLHPIQVIGSEAILCGQLLSDSSVKCMVHGTVGPSKVDLMVRAANPQFSQAVLTQCGVALGSS